MATAYELFVLTKVYLEKNHDYLRSNSLFHANFIRRPILKQNEVGHATIISSDLF